MQVGGILQKRTVVDDWDFHNLSETTRLSKHQPLRNNAMLSL